MKQRNEYTSLCYVFGDEFLDFFDEYCLPSFILSINSTKNLDSFFFKFATNSQSKAKLERIAAKHNLRFECVLVNDLEIQGGLNHINVWDAMLRTVETNYVFLLIPDWIFSKEYVAEAIKNCEQNKNTISYPIYCCKDALLSNKNIIQRLKNGLNKDKLISKKFISEIACEYAHPLYFALFEKNGPGLTHLHFEASIKEASNTEVIFITNAQHAHVLVTSEKGKSINEYLHSSSFNFSLGYVVTVDKIDNMLPMITFGTRFYSLGRKFKAIYRRRARPNSKFFTKRNLYYFRYSDRVDNRTYEILRKPKNVSEITRDILDDYFSFVYDQYKQFRKLLFILGIGKIKSKNKNGISKLVKLCRFLTKHISHVPQPNKQHIHEINKESTENNLVDEACRIVSFDALTVYGWYFNFLSEYKGFLGNGTISHIKEKFAMLADTDNDIELKKLSKELSKGIFQDIEAQLLEYNAQGKNLSPLELQHFFFTNCYRK